MFGECHGHIFMNGISYPHAVNRHQIQPDESYIRKVLSIYQKYGITFVRDGGDYLNVSLLAKELAPEYGIDYRTPVFAIHKKDYYGSIVGNGFSNMNEFCNLMDLADANGCDFIKLMVSGILSYNDYGKLSCPSLPPEEIKELIHTVHERGFAVMVHVNDDISCLACIESHADSIEHGFFMSRATLTSLSESDTIWCPTLAPSYAAVGSGRFSDSILNQITHTQMENVRYASKIGCTIAAGSDAGAYHVMHGEGIRTEVELLLNCGLTNDDLDLAEKLIHERFQR